MSDDKQDGFWWVRLNGNRWVCGELSRPTSWPVWADWTADDVERLARSIAPRILTMDGLLAVPMINVLRERGIKNVRHKGAR